MARLAIRTVFVLLDVPVLSRRQCCDTTPFTGPASDWFSRSLTRDCRSFHVVQMDCEWCRRSFDLTNWLWFGCQRVLTPVFVNRLGYSLSRRRSIMICL